MRFTSLAVLAVAPLLAAAVNITVQVGANGLSYTPSNFTANVGDIVNFVFYAKNHTVTQSSFAAPCTKFVNTTTNAVGIASGFVPVAANTTGPTWSIQIATTDPLWFYCGQTGHCGAGMVGAINAVESSTKNYAAFKAAAMATAGGSTSAAPGYGGGAGSPSTTGTGSASTPKPSNAASSLGAGGAAVALTAASLFAGLFL